MIAFSRHGTWTVIDLHGPLNPVSINALDCVLTDLANDEVGDLALNLGNVDFLDAHHLQTLSQAFSHVRQHAPPSCRRIRTYPNQLHPRNTGHYSLAPHLPHHRAPRVDPGRDTRCC